MCYQCGKTGHIARFCPQNREARIHSVTVGAPNYGCNTGCQEDREVMVPAVRIVHQNPPSQPAIADEDSPRKTPFNPFFRGTVNGQKESSILRDTGADECAVAQRLVHREDYTGRKVIATFASGEVMRTPTAWVRLDTPFFSGVAEAIVFENPPADFIVANTVTDRRGRQWPTKVQPGEGIAESGSTLTKTVCAYRVGVETEKPALCQNKLRKNLKKTRSAVKEVLASAARDSKKKADKMSKCQSHDGRPTQNKSKNKQDKKVSVREREQVREEALKVRKSEAKSRSKRAKGKPSEAKETVEVSGEPITEPHRHKRSKGKPSTAREEFKVSGRPETEPHGDKRAREEPSEAKGNVRVVGRPKIKPRKSRRSEGCRDTNIEWSRIREQCHRWVVWSLILLLVLRVGGTLPANGLSCQPQDTRVDTQGIGMSLRSRIGNCMASVLIDTKTCPRSGECLEALFRRSNKANGTDLIKSKFKVEKATWSDQAFEKLKENTDADFLSRQYEEM